jgi:hypothetical protein
MRRAIALGKDIGILRKRPQRAQIPLDRSIGGCAVAQWSGAQQEQYCSGAVPSVERRRWGHRRYRSVGAYSHATCPRITLLPELGALLQSF